MELVIETSPIYIPLFNNLSTKEYRYIVLRSGRGTGKSVAAAQYAVLKAYELSQTGKEGSILCGREFQNSLEDSSLEEIKRAISLCKLQDAFDIGTKYVRTKDNKIEFIFSGLRRNLESLKSKARILLVVLEEAEQISDEAYMKLLPTIREEGSEFVIVYNPEEEESATNRRFYKNPPPRTLIIEGDYRDNKYWTPALEETRAHDESTLDKETYNWIWLGHYRTISNAQIFKNFTVKNLLDLDNTDLIIDGKIVDLTIFRPYYGMDFGFSNDPTVIVECIIDSNNNLYITRSDEKTGLELDHTSKWALNIIPELTNSSIRADNSRPESISFLKRNGLPNIVPCKKGPNSIIEGIEHIKSFNHIYIHDELTNVINEFKNYKYIERNGVILPKPADEHNHAIDAIRYALEPLRHKSYSWGGLVN